MVGLYEEPTYGSVRTTFLKILRHNHVSDCIVEECGNQGKNMLVVR